MTAVQKDSVIQFLEDYVTRNPDKHVGMYMLYADPNGSGLDPEKIETLRPLYERIQKLNASGYYDYEGTEKPVISVSIQTRVRHTISELMALHEIVGLLRTWILVHDAKGSKWPPKPIEIPGVAQVKSRFPAIKMALIRSLKSSINEALIKDLPTLIDDVYRAKYKSSGTFSYSLAETKLYTMKNDFLSAALTWIGHVIQIDTLAHNNAILQVPATAANPNPIQVSRETIIWDDWFAYSYSKQRDSHKFAPNYMKLCSAICARFGKLKYAAPSSEDYNLEQLVSGMLLIGDLSNDLNLIGSQLQIDPRSGAEALDPRSQIINTEVKRVYEYVSKRVSGPGLLQPGLLPFVAASYKDAKKKLFQVKLYESFMIYVQNVYERAKAYGEGDSAPKRTFIVTEVNKILNIIKNHTAQLGIENGLVYLDVLSMDKAFYTKSDFLTIQKAFSQTGVCNERLVNAITKFISNVSLLSNDYSRKQMDPSIETVIVQQADFSKIKITSPDDPSIIFSRQALALMSDSVRMRFENLVDKKAPGAVGYVQKGVMSWTAALKTDNENWIAPSLERMYDASGREMRIDDVLRFCANQLDEIATMYRAIINPILDARKKVISDNEKTIKRHKQWGVGAVGIHQPGMGGVSPSQYMTQSQSAAYVPAAHSPSQAFNNGMFPSQHPHVLTQQQLPVPSAVAYAPIAPPESSFHHDQVSHQVHPHIIHNIPAPLPEQPVHAAPEASPVKTGGGLFDFNNMGGVASPPAKTEGSLFASRSPALGGLFGSSNVPSHGVSSPLATAAVGGGLFGSSNAPSHGVSSPLATAAVGGGLFGGNPASSGRRTPAGVSSPITTAAVGGGLFGGNPASSGRRTPAGATSGVFTSSL